MEMCGLHLLLLLSLSVGSTEDESLQNFKEWCDSIALRCCSSADECLVKDWDRNRKYGLFHHMKKGEHDDFESQLSDFRVWAAECEQANLSGGKYFSVAPSGRG